jgi:hypothetical protein
MLIDLYQAKIILMKLQQKLFFGEVWLVAAVQKNK